MFKTKSAAHGQHIGSSNLIDPTNTIQKKNNNGGLPSNLKSGVEKLSGQDMSDVSVHKNSDKPAQLNAHAYAQGKDIHLGPGQEKHLPHEAWHIAQQKQGRVQPNKQLKSDIPINDDDSLEKEADEMGMKALQAGSEANYNKNSKLEDKALGNTVADISQLKAIQKIADGSNSVRQLKEFDALVNKRDKEGIRQLQEKAGRSKSNLETTQSLSYNAPENNTSSAESNDQNEINSELNEI